MFECYNNDAPSLLWTKLSLDCGQEDHRSSFLGMRDTHCAEGHHRWHVMLTCFVLPLEEKQRWMQEFSPESNFLHWQATQLFNCTCFVVGTNSERKSRRVTLNLKEGRECVSSSVKKEMFVSAICRDALFVEMCASKAGILSLFVSFSVHDFSVWVMQTYYCRELSSPVRWFFSSPCLPAFFFFFDW